MFEPRLHTVHRTAFLTGVLAYASSPLWLAFLLLSTLLFTQSVGSDPTYFTEPYQLFPVWPTANVALMLTLFGLTAVLLLAPKVFSLVAIVGRGEARRFGGAPRLFASALFEFVHSLLLAPVRMLFHSQFVLAALSGWRLDWKSPPRDDASTPWREAAARHGIHTALAVLWIAAILATSTAFPWWLSPILVGLLLAIPLSVFTSRVRIGRALRRQGLLLTPEESREPRVLREARDAAASVAARLVTLRAAITDRSAQERVVAALAATPRAARRQGRRRSRAHRSPRCATGPPAIGADEDRLRLLSSASALAVLRREVIARRAHPDWWQWQDAVATADDVATAPMLPWHDTADAVLSSNREIVATASGFERLAFARKAAAGRQARCRRDVLDTTKAHLAAACSSLSFFAPCRSIGAVSAASGRPGSRLARGPRRARARAAAAPSRSIQARLRRAIPRGGALPRCPAARAVAERVRRRHPPDRRHDRSGERPYLRVQDRRHGCRFLRRRTQYR